MIYFLIGLLVVLLVLIEILIKPRLDSFDVNGRRRFIVWYGQGFRRDWVKLFTI